MKLNATPITGPSFTDAVTPGTTKCYTVKATDGVNESVASNAVEFTADLFAPTIMITIPVGVKLLTSDGKEVAQIQKIP